MFEGFMERMSRIDSAIDIFWNKYTLDGIRYSTRQEIFTEISNMFGIGELTSDEKEYILMKFDRKGIAK